MNKTERYLVFLEIIILFPEITITKAGHSFYTLDEGFFLHDKEKTIFEFMTLK